MKKITNLLLMSSLSIICSLAQNQTYGIENTVEHTVKIKNPVLAQKDDKLFSFVNSVSNGFYYKYIDYRGNNQKWQQWEYQFFLYNEKNATFKSEFIGFISDGKYLSSFNIQENKFFYSEDYFTSPEDTGYRLLYLFYLNDKHYLDSVYSTDKKVFSSFSKDNKILLVNNFYELPDFYNLIKDNYTYIYYLDDIQSGIKKDSIYCKHCSNSTLIDDKLFYTISNEKDEWDNYTWKEIYVAPWGNISDTTRIASRTRLLAVSSDGKYILGKRYDLFNGVCVIIDVETKKYQILIGRDYQSVKSFYSEVEKKFGFDFDDEIIYVDYPKTYPFDALLKDNPLVPITKSREIRKIFEK